MAALAELQGGWATRMGTVCQWQVMSLRAPQHSQVLKRPLVPTHSAICIRNIHKC